MLECGSERSGAEEPKGRVLLIDDEQPVLRAYGRVLRQAGFSVELLADASRVESAMREHDFDVVVSDIALVGMDGFDVLRTVHERDPDLPVVLMTAGGELGNAVKAVEHGALRYLLKPVAANVLHQTAEDAVRLRRVAKLKRRALELYGRAVQSETKATELAVRFDRALERIYMVYQPIVRVTDRTVFAYEALVRTGEESLRRPDELFSAAEQLGRVHEIGRVIRARVAEDVGDAPDGVNIFVNLHPRDLEDDELLSPDAPLSRLASRVVLEVTERASLDRVADLRPRLSALRELGFWLALDDLGAGYAGLTSFAQLEPEVVKLDMSLTRDVDREPTKRKLIQMMAALCKELDVVVIGEGVENEAERETLRELGCELQQGYFFAKPARPFPEVGWQPHPRVA